MRLRRLLRALYRHARGRRLLAGALASSVLFFCAVPVGVRAQNGPGSCIYEGGSPTTPARNVPAFAECDSSRNLQVKVVSGTITTTVTFPYAGTNGQTLSTNSFLGIGARDANGQFSPLQLDSAQNLLTKSVTGSTTAVTQATGTNLHTVVDSGAVTTTGSGNFTVVQPTAANLNATVVGAGVAGTPAGGVASVQGVAGGTALSVSGGNWVAAGAATPTTTSVTASATSASLVAPRAGRKGLILYNHSTTVADYIAFNQAASIAAGGYTYALSPGGTLELLQNVYPGQINYISDSADGSYLNVTELY